MEVMHPGFGKNGRANNGDVSFSYRNGIFSINRGDRVNRTPLLVKDEKLAIVVG